MLAVEAFVGENSGVYRTGELAAALGDILSPAAVAEIVAYLLGAGRIALDDEGCLVRPDERRESQAP